MMTLSHLNFNSYLYLNQNHNLNLNPYQYQLGMRVKAHQKRAYRDSSVRKMHFFNIGSAHVEDSLVRHSCFPTSTVPVNCLHFTGSCRGMGINGVLSFRCPGGERVVVG